MHRFFHRNVFVLRGSVHDASVDVWDAVLAQAHPPAQDVAAAVDHVPAARARDLGDRAMGMLAPGAVARSRRHH
jgi:hypothetical protein